jgi:Ca-activated chloride channel family protein
MTNGNSNYYQVLNLAQDASTQEIEEAYKRLRARITDGEGDANVPDLAVISHAYEVLSNPERRRLYDSLLAETDELPIVADILTSRSRIPLLNESQLVYVLVELLAPTTDEKESLPLNLCLVIDRSTSMEGERLQQIKLALKMLLDRLSPGTVLSVVSFSDRAEIVLPSLPVGKHRQPMTEIEAVHASGGTEIYQGLTAGIQQIKQVALSTYNNQLILFTDGRTYGDAAHCLQLAAREAEAGITISAFGIGSDWDDQFLDTLVSPSGGSAAYIDAPETIIDLLKSRLQGLGDISAHQVRLQTDWPSRVKLLDAFRLNPYAKPLSIDEEAISLGDVESREGLTFLLEFAVEPHPIPTRIRIPLVMTAEMPEKNSCTLREQVQLTLLDDFQTDDPPEKVIRAVRLLTLYRLNERAWQKVDSGKVDQAAAHMQHLSTRFLEVGESRLAKQAELEARRLSVSGKLSPEGRKQLKYGTRALMGKTIQLEWND